jgi:hypothetical protein
VAGNDFSVTVAMSWHEVPQWDAKGAGETEQQAELGVDSTGLSVLHGPPVDAGNLGKLLLREVGLKSGIADPVAQLDPGPMDPWRCCRLHPQNT